MNDHRVPQLVDSQAYFDQFWLWLSWDKLEKRIKEALQHSDQAIPLETNCTVVMDLAKQIVHGLGNSAIQKPGQVVSQEEIHGFDQRLIILRIMEAVISLYEDWKNARYPERVTTDVRSVLKILEEKK